MCAVTLLDVSGYVLRSPIPGGKHRLHSSAKNASASACQAPGGLSLAYVLTFALLSTVQLRSLLVRIGGDGHVARCNTALLRLVFRLCVTMSASSKQQAACPACIPIAGLQSNSGRNKYSTSYTLLLRLAAEAPPFSALCSRLDDRACLSGTT